MWDMRYAFCDCSIDTDTHRLTRDGQEQKVEPQVFDLLCLLVENAGNLVTLDEMIARVWQGRIVSDSAISARIAAARKAVGDDGKRQAIIRTISRRGLQFVAGVTTGGQDKAPIGQPDAKLTIRYATATDGAKLAYAAHGAGPALIRIAHFPTHLELDWNEPTERAFFDKMMQRLTLVRFDMRGSGLSEPRNDNWSIDQLADDIGRVADALGLNHFALMGTSGGSLPAVNFAARYPERVSKLVIQCGYVDGRMVRDRPAGNAPPDTLLGLMREGWGKEKLPYVAAAMMAYMPDADSETLRQFARNFQASATVESEIIARDGMNNASTAECLGRVSAPTLVLHSRDDGVHPLSEARKMAGGIINAELVVLESANHYVLPSEPAWQQLMETLFEFLERP